MRLPTVSKSAAALSVAAALFLAAVPSSAQMSQSNPLQYVEIETGHKNINDQIKKQTKAQEKTGLLQATISAEFTKIKQWEGKYNSYLKTARGYAEAIKAGTSLYAEGVETLRHIHEKEADLIYVDPPYESQTPHDILRALSKEPFVTENTLIIVESSLDTDFSYLEEIGLMLVREKDYRANRHLFIRRKV